MAISINGWGQNQESPLPNSRVWNLKIGTQFNLGRIGTENIRAFISIGKSFKICSYLYFDSSLALDLYTGGLGTNQGNTRHWYPVFESNIAGGFTAGACSGRMMTMNIYHNFSGNEVSSSYGGSASFGMIQTISSVRRRYPGRDQTNAYIYVKIKDVTLGMYNDLFITVIPGIRQNDSYWTGGGELQVMTDSRGIASFVYDGYTGKRPTNLEYYPAPPATGQKYYDQLIDEQLLNNGLTSLRFSNDDYTFGINHVGNGVMNGQWFQNFIHSRIFKKHPIPWFLNTSKESLQITGSKSWNKSME